MKPELIHPLSFRKYVHRNQKVILCTFPYDPELLKGFRSEFPSAKWSRTHNVWYVKDSTLYQSRLKLPPPEIGDVWLSEL